MMSGSLAGGSQPNWDKVKPEAEEPKTWVDQAAESVRNLPHYEYELKVPEDLLKDPRVTKPIREIALVTGLSIREVEEALLALLSPPNTKRRH